MITPTSCISDYDEFDQLASDLLADRSGWVITHGEPHAGNIIRTRSGSMVVVDWAFAALAPRERDLWMLLEGSDPDWSAYHEVTQVSAPSEQALTAYRLHWNLKDIAIFVSMCRSPHEETEEMAMIWAELEAYVNGVSSSLCRAG